MKRLIGLLLLLPLLALGQIRSTLYDSLGNVLRVSTENHVVHTHEAVRGFKIEFLDFPRDQWTVDNTSDKLNYYGNWVIGDDSSPTGCGCSYSSIQNDSVTYYFTDVERIEFWGEQMSHHGIGEIWVDNVLDTILDTYSSINQAPTLNWFKDGLDPNKTHSWKMVITGTRNPASTGAPVVLQYLKLFAPVVEPPPPEVDPNNPITLSNGIIVSASSYQNDVQQGWFNPPAHSMDDDFDTGWSAEGNGEWIQYELPSYQTIESISLATALGDEMAYTFDIKLGNDGVNWDASYTGLQTSGQSLGLEKFIVNDRDAKFIRLIGRGSSENLWNNYAEARINIKVTIPPDTIPPPQNAQFKFVPIHYYVTNMNGNLSVHFNTYEEAATHAMELKSANPDADVWVQYINSKVEIKKE